MRVAIYGAGQLGSGVARLLRERGGVEVAGPYGREARAAALCGGADVVLIATTSFLADVAEDVRTAVEHGSNVVTSAEEAACPWVVDAALADELDALARERGVTILGAGLNPGLAFDAIVVTALGGVARADRIAVERVVDLSGFGPVVLRRLGIGFAPGAFAAGVRDGTIFGHIGFPQSMQTVARRTGVTIERIERELEPLLAGAALRAGELEVAPGESAGFNQRYTAIVEGAPWFEARFTGHIDLAAEGLAPRDAIELSGPTPLRLTIEPGIDPQQGSTAVLANSLRRLVEAPAGWLTVAHLPPAAPDCASDLSRSAPPARR